MLVADDEPPHPGQAALLEAGHEALPEDLVLAVTYVQAQDLSLPCRAHTGGDHDRHGHHLGGLVPHVQVGRIQVDVGELGVVQRPGAERRPSLLSPGRRHPPSSRCSGPCSPPRTPVPTARMHDQVDALVTDLRRAGLSPVATASLRSSSSTVA